MISTNLQKDMQKAIASAKYVKIAVALAKKSEVQKLLQAVNENMEEAKIILGYDLPTDPEVFRILSKDPRIECYTLYKSGNKSFHPKIYMFSSDNKNWDIYLGSGNWTKGGWGDNWELNVKIKDKDQINDALDWFAKLLNDAEHVTNVFINTYSERWDTLKAARKRYRDKEKAIKKALVKDIAVNKGDKNALIKLIKQKLKRKSEKKILKQRNRGIQNMRRAIGLLDNYETFDTDLFFDQKELGNLVDINKKSFRENKDLIRQNIPELLNEDLPLADRYNNFDALGFSAGKNIITKMLCLAHPEKYFVLNGVTNPLLAIYGIDYRPRTDKGKRYENMNKEVLEIADEAGVTNMIALDAILYDIYHELTSRYARYWKGFKEYLSDTESRFEYNGNSKVHSIDLYKIDDNKKITLNCNAHGKGKIYVGLDFPGTTKTEIENNYTSWLKEKKKSLEKTFGGLKSIEINYDPNTSKKQRIIQIVNKSFDPKKEETWSDQYDWFVEIAERLYEICKR